MKHALPTALFWAFFTAKAFSHGLPGQTSPMTGACELAAQIFPTDQKLWVVSCSPDAAAFVFDSNGGLVESFLLNEGENFLDCQKLETGLYLAVLTEKDGTSATFSIAKN